MLNPLAFDASQTLPSAPPSLFHQTAGWSELQQVASFPRRIALDVSRLGASVLSQGYPCQQIRPNRDVATQLRILQQHYLIMDSSSLISELLGEDAALFTLLVEAVRPLRTAFGENRLLQVRVQHSDDDSLLKVAVQLPGDFGDDPESALRSFDREWWLENCHRSGGALVFDYEIRQNAV
jgi:hypothetical protein